MNSRRFLPHLLLLVLAIGCDEPHPTVVSTPPSAAVWADDVLLGQTPLALTKAETGLELTVRLPGYRDTNVTVPGGTRSEVAVELLPAGGHTLTCTSEPSGASVFLDGERMGETPLTVRDLDRDVIEVSFQMKNHEQVSQAVRFDDKATQTLAVVLPNLTEKYYRQRLRNEPDIIHHYCDLAHHYVLGHDFDKAAAVFGQAVDLLARTPGTADASRLWSEIDRVTTEQYDYGDLAAVNKARAILCRELERLLKRHGDKSPLQLYTSQIAMLDTLNQRQRAQDVFDQAWKQHPNDRTLRRVAKQRRMVIP